MATKAHDVHVCSACGHSSHRGQRGDRQPGDGIVFEIPWREVGILMAVALVASLLATAWPARQASQIPPAVALRIAD